MGQSVEELGRVTRWILENTQVGIKREEQTVLEPKKDPKNMTDDELCESLKNTVRNIGYQLVPLEECAEESDSKEGTEDVSQP